MKRRGGFLCLAMLICAAACGADLPVAEAVKIDRPPKLDGKLDEPFWQQAKTCGDFYLWNSAGKKTDATEFKIAYDDTWLYFGIDCKNAKISMLHPKIKGHDKGACQDDSVEIFLDPGTAGKMYFHYMFSWGGAKDERIIRGENRDLAWDVPWRAAADVRKDGWSAEIAIPLYLILSYGSFDKVKFNVTRNIRIPNVDNCAVVVSESMQSSCWSPVVKSFHEPSRFGGLTKIECARLNVPALAAFDEAAVLPYYDKNGVLYYEVELTVKGFNNKAARVIMTVMDMPSGAEKMATSQPLTVNDTAARKIKIAVPAKTMAEREITVLMKDAATGEILQSAAIEDMSPLKVMSAYTDRNYYTTEENACIICTVGMPEAALKNKTVAVKNQAGKIIGGPAEAAPRTAIPVPLEKIAAGVSRVTVELSESGKKFFAVPLEMIKREPKPGCEWKIDRINRVVLNNGKPFFPLGIVVHTIKPTDEDRFKDVADAGFNILPCWQKLQDPKELADYRRMCRKYNLYLLPFIDDMCMDSSMRLETLSSLAPNYSELAPRFMFSVTNAKGGLVVGPLAQKLTLQQRNQVFEELVDKTLPRIVAGIDACKDSPQLSAYFFFDEPAADSMFLQSKFGKKVYNAINRADGYHPAVINYSSYIPPETQYTDFMDILMTDPYWVPGGETGRNTPDFVSKIVAWTDLRAKEKRLVTWIVPVAESWSGCRKRFIVPEEQYVQTYLAVIHGAKGLLYFCYKPKMPQNWAALKQVNAQMNVLAPAVLNAEVPQSVKYFNATDTAGFTEVFFRPEKEEFPDVQVRLFQYPGGDYVLLAANSKTWPVEVRYEISGLREAAGIFTEQVCKVEDGAFAEKLQKYETRAYRLKLAGGVKFPVAVKVSARHNSKDVTPPETSWPYSGRTGKKNILPNPSFEEETLAGLPDYYRQMEGATRSMPSSEARFGKKSFMLRKTPDCNFGGVFTYCGPQNDQPLPYVFSFYAKGNKPGLKLWVRAFQYDDQKRYSKDITVTDQWERYYFSGIVPARGDLRTLCEIRLVSDGEVLVDGLQLEKGTVPTEFEE